MEIITRNTNTAARKVYPLFQTVGQSNLSRNGKVLRIPGVTTITLRAPQERVNLSPVRDANPFFHLVEAMAMLVACNDVELMAFYSSGMRNYSDDGKTFNAFYGTRARETWGDQLPYIIQELQAKPDSRQCYVDLWDVRDLDRETKDRACNLGMLFQINQIDNTLEMTTFNRSNDGIWGGVSGANVVHFSFFQEFIALCIGKEIGSWHHVSANLHAYTELQGDLFKALVDEATLPERAVDGHHLSMEYPAHMRLDGFLSDCGEENPDFDQKLFETSLCSILEILMETIQGHTDGNGRLDEGAYDTFLERVDSVPAQPFLDRVFIPFVAAHLAWKGDRDGNFSTIQNLLNSVHAADWRVAGASWLNRRYQKRSETPLAQTQLLNESW